MRYINWNAIGVLILAAVLCGFSWFGMYLFLLMVLEGK